MYSIHSHGLARALVVSAREREVVEGEDEARTSPSTSGSGEMYGRS